MTCSGGLVACVDRVRGSSRGLAAWRLAFYQKELFGVVLPCSRAPGFHLVDLFAIGSFENSLQP